MNPEDIEETSEVLKSISGRNRFYSYVKLYQGEEPKHIAYDLDITRNAVQHYIDDWKEHGLIEKNDQGYQRTERGSTLFQSLNVLHNELNKSDTMVEEEDKKQEF